MSRALSLRIWEDWHLTSNQQVPRDEDAALTGEGTKAQGDSGGVALPANLPGRVSDKEVYT